MPIYEYKCAHCNHIFEEFQKSGETGANLKCPACGATAPEKMFSSFAASGLGHTASGSGSSSGHSCGSGGFG
ncbi:MAG TPA: zinc ribbon domain-containing protein [bacterium]|nr:zinc ribbon domain-containing protein [bacterium]HPN43262.1 zinc ribbon domain-containing protein [bacterium]